MKFCFCFYVLVLVLGCYIVTIIAETIIFWGKFSTGIKLHQLIRNYVILAKIWVK